MKRAQLGADRPSQPLPSDLRYRSTTGGVFYLLKDAVSDFGSGPLQKKALIRLSAEQVYFLGSQSLGLIAASGLAMGAIMALQYGNGLQRFGGTLYVPELVALSIFRELGPILTSLLLAGRAGSGITSELASMNVTEQIDAIRALGDSPNSTLVLPRVIASLLVFPILTLFSEFASVLAALIVAYTDLSIGPVLYVSKTLQILQLADLWTGLLKTVVFSLFISLAACWRGLNTVGGTRGVGASTTWIVVRSSIFILICDFFLNKLFILTVLKHG